MKGFERENVIKIEKKKKSERKQEEKKRKEKKGVFHLSLLSNIKRYINLTFF
jgi:hypothetical protein